jgi:hypothetical protein
MDLESLMLVATYKMIENRTKTTETHRKESEDSEREDMGMNAGTGS